MGNIILKIAGAHLLTHSWIVESVLLFIVCSQLNNLKHSKWLNSTIGAIDETLNGIKTPG